MKKYIVMLVVIGLTVFGGLAYGVNMIWNQKDAVKIEYEVLEGDPAVAEGITFHVRNQWSGKLHWDSQVTLGEGGMVVKAVTELEDRFADPTEETYYSYNRFYEKVNLHLEHNGFAVENTWIQASGCDEAVCREMLEKCAAETKPGETKTKTVPLKEYQAYYDLYLNLNLGSGSYYVVGDEWEMVDKWFQIMIPDSHQMEVTVQKDEQGEIIMQRCDCAYGLQTLECSAVQTADGVYFVFYGVDTEGQPYDLRLERGNGIFCIPLAPVEEESKSVYYSSETIVNYEKAKNAFLLPDKDCYPLELIADEEEQVLYLLTKEQEKAVLRIIDITTMEERQKLELMDNPYYWNEQQMDVLEEGLVVLLGDNSFCYLEEKNGVLEKKIAVNLGEGPRTSDGKYWYDLVYQDAKASLIIAEYGNGSTEAYVYVLSENAVEYKAHFVPSFAYEQYGGYDWIHLRREEPLEITME